MKIESRRVDELIHAEYNPRYLNENDYKALKDSLTRFGVVDPVIVNMYPERRNIVVGGHQRLKVWQEMGNTEIPCVYVELPLDKERELNVRLNKNTGRFDMDVLANQFDIDELTDWGFSEEELTGDDFGEEIQLGEEKKQDDDNLELCKCPKCGFEFEKGNK
jgi:ParB-like chromosome segregation protein Spo0J